MQGELGLAAPHGPCTIFFKTMSYKRLRSAASKGSSVSSGLGGNSAHTTPLTKSGLKFLSWSARIISI